MDTDDPARYRTIPLVRLPSIDHGLAPFPEGMLQMLPLRRGSLTDPLVHAHIPAAASQHLQHHHQQQHQLQAARQLFPEYNDEQRLSAGYPNQPYWPSASASSSSNGPGSSLFPVQESSIDTRYSDTQHNRRTSGSSNAIVYNQKQATFPVQHGTKRKTLDASQTDEGDAHYYPTTSIPYTQQGSANSAFFPEQQQQQQVPGEAALKKRASIASVEGGEVAGRLGKTAKELQQHITSGSTAVKLDETNVINSRLQDRRDSATSSTNGSAFQRVNAQQPSYAFPLSSQHQHDPASTRSPPPAASNLATYTFGRPSPSPAAGGSAEGYVSQQQQNVPHVSLSEPQHSSPENGHARIPSVLSTEAQSRASTIFGGGGMNGSNNVQTDQRGAGGEEDDDDTASGGGGGGGIEGSMGRLKPPSHGTYTKETPYSRSPELKISHKMAERKRRKEMKELFDDLRDSIPTERGLKSSKWEVLSKAIEYIAKLMEEKEADYRITQDLKVHINSLENALQLARQQVHSLQQQQQQQAMSSASPVSMHSGPPQPPANLFPHPTAPLPSQSHSNWTPSPSPLGSTFSGHHQSSLPPAFHHRSQSHGQLSHPHSHTASSAPPAIYHSHSHPGTFPDHHSSGHNSHNHSYQSSSAGGATATRPPSIHSHNSNHSIHSVHSMHSNQGIGSPGPGPTSGSGHGGPHLLSPSPTNPSLMLQQQNLASVQEDYQLFAHAPPAGQQQPMQHLQQQQQQAMGGPNGHMAY